MLAYYEKKSEDKESDKNTKPLFYRVYDVKYKKPCESTGIRNDRLQFLAYCFMYCVTKRDDIQKKFVNQDTDDKSDTNVPHWYSGLIFPSQQSKSSDHIAINRLNDDVYYHQFFVDIKDKNTNHDFEFLEW